jgi:WD40 repeat protein
MARDQKAVQRDRELAGFPGQKVQRGCVRLPFVSGVFACLVVTIGITELFHCDESQGCNSEYMSIVKGEDNVSTMSLVVSPQGTLLATTDTKGRVSLHSKATGWHIDEYVDYSGYAMCVAISSDARFLAIGGQKSSVVVEAQRRDGPRKMELLPIARARAIAFSPDGRYVAAASVGSNRVVLWDRARGRQNWICVSRMPIISLAFSPDGQTLAAGAHGDRASIYIWDLEMARVRLVLNGSVGPVVSVAFSPDSQKLASAANFENGARLWDTRTGRLYSVLRGHRFGTNSIVFSPEGETLASAGNDGAVRLWSVATGEQQFVLDGRVFRLNCVAFSPDSRRLFATGSADNDIRIWKWADPEPARAKRSTANVASTPVARALAIN